MTPLVIAGLNLLGQGTNAFAQGTVNRASRKWNEKMYGIQRRDALADFAMQNEYNHPSSVMQRLRDAKLNPNLVYGSGSATTPSASVRSSDKGSWNPKAPEFNFTEGIAAYIDFKVKEAQVDNLREQNTVLKMEALLKDEQRYKTHVEARTAEGMMPHVIDAKRLEVDKLHKEISWIGTQEEIARAMKQPNINKVIQEVLNMKAERLLKIAQTSTQKQETLKKIEEIKEVKARVENLYTEGKLKNFDLKLKEVRGKRSDWPAFWKAVTDVIIQLFPEDSGGNPNYEGIDTPGRR